MKPQLEPLQEPKRPGTPARGRLKVFLGAAPGVGKTYEMLVSARDRMRAGADVVVGIVETHGRPEIEALLEGMEIIPPRNSLNGAQTAEFNLDALLKRKPRIALVDDIAHKNAPGSRHPRRYLDVQELLEAGIDVFTTLNIQHVESLNDLVAQITRIRVRDKVPDSVLNEADDIEVIDLSPDELIQRLEEGKVHVSKHHERALRHYFSPGSLTALRELALRRTAQRVDEQLLAHMRAHSIEGPWATGERILVCIGEDKRSAGLVRYTKRLADRYRAPWTALYIETPRYQQLTEVERDRIADTLRLAERLQGEALTIPGTGKIAEDVLEYAQANHVTQIVVGKSERPRWFELLRGSVVHDLVRRAGNISVHVIAGGQLFGDPIPKKTVRTRPAPTGNDIVPYVGTALSVLGALSAAMLLEPYFGVETVDLIFLVVIMGIAYTFGLWQSLLAAFASMYLYNYFFLAPLYRFAISTPKNIAALFFFLIAAVLVSNLTARVRAQALTARNRAATAEALYVFSKKLAGIVSMDDLLWATVSQIASSIKADVVILLPDALGELQVKAGYPPEDSLDEQDLAAARFCFENNRPAGRNSDSMPEAKRLYLPLRTGAGAVGVVGLGSEQKPDFSLTPDERRLLDALMDQAAVAIERVRLVGEARQASAA